MKARFSSTIFFFLCLNCQLAFAQNFHSTIGYGVGGPNGISSFNLKAQYDEWYGGLKFPIYVLLSGDDEGVGMLPSVNAGKTFGKTQHKLYGEAGYIFKGYLFADVGYMWIPEDSKYQYKIGLGNYIYWPTFTVAVEYRFFSK